jgi:hypothetical protein
MNSKTGKWIETGIVAVVNIVLWLGQSELAYNIAQERDILLGRFTVDRFTLNLVISVISLFVINGIWTAKKVKTAQQKRQDTFKAIALALSIIFSLAAADAALRILKAKQYQGRADLFFRTPDTIQQGIVRDVPATAFSYPVPAKGFGDFEFTITIDKNGFRNKTDFEKCDIITLGDSFTEGSHVSDEQVWPVLLSERSGLKIYNLGMSGGNPVSYLELIKRFAPKFSPRIVMCVLYEGNDFRSSNFEGRKLQEKQQPQKFSLFSYIKSSPLRLGLKNLFIRLFGPPGSQRFAGDMKAGEVAPDHPIYAVSWLPVAVPRGADAKYYAFNFKSLRDECQEKTAFETSGGWKGTSERLLEIKKLCDENNIRLVVVFAPDKPHLLMPLIKDDVPKEKLYAFMSLKMKNLPPVGEITDFVCKNLDSKESVVAEFCNAQSIGFLSLTKPLQDAIKSGKQAYFTYDQHWTPVGHSIVADAAFDFFNKQNVK